MLYLEWFEFVKLMRGSFIVKNGKKSFAIVEKTIFYTNAYYSIVQEKYRVRI